MKFYTRSELVKILGCDEGFLMSLEREEILVMDNTEASDDAAYSDRMLERARVARNLIQDLDVNLEGAAIIVRMREEIADLHRQIVKLLRQSQ